MSQLPRKYTPQYLLQEAIKWTEYGLQRGLIYFLRCLLPRRKGSLTSLSFSDAKVLFLRQNQIGDALISTPIFAALKRHYPQLTIDVLLDRRNATALDGNPHIRTRYVIKQTRFDIFHVLRAIRKERYDLVVDLIHSASSTSTLICLLSGARIICGFERENDFVYDATVRLPTGQRMLRQLAEILRLFHLDPDAEPLEPVFYCSPASQAFAARVVKPLRQHRKYVIGLNISASSTTFKFWGTDNFIALAQHLHAKFPDTVLLLLYSPAYRSLAERIAAHSAAVLCDTTPTLSDFAAVIAQLDMLITPDSAAAHLADIFRVPVFILTYLPEGETAWYPSFTPFAVIHSENGMVASIPPEKVLPACQAFIAQVLFSPDGT